MNLGLNLNIDRAASANGGTGPVSDFLTHYLMDGSDANLTAVGTESYVAAPELLDAQGKSHDGSTQYATVNPDSGIWATIGDGAFSVALWLSSADLALNRGILATGDGSLASNIRIRITSAGVMQLTTNGS